jgi:RimJ/RimL family protein N-acetyltransferase
MTSDGGARGVLARQDLATMEFAGLDTARSLVSCWRMWRQTGMWRIDYGQIVLRRDELTLRPFQSADLPRFLEIVRDPEVVRFSHLPEDWRTSEGGLDYLRSLPRLAAAGRRVDLAIETRRPGGVVGRVALRDIFWSEGRAAVATSIAAEARGSGIASEALALISDWAFAELGLRRVEADPDRENTASQRMLERAGFVAEGTSHLDDGRRIVIYWRAAPESNGAASGKSILPLGAAI